MQVRLGGSGQPSPSKPSQAKMRVSFIAWKTIAGSQWCR